MIYSMKRRWLIIALIFLAASAGLTTVLLMRRSPTAKTADQQPTTEQPASEQHPAPAPPPNTDQEAQPTKPSTPPASSPTAPKQQPQAPPSAPPSRPTPPQQPQQPQPPRPTPPAPPARPTPPPAPPKPTPPPPSKYDVGPPNALEMLELMNDARRRAGIRPLVLNSRLQYTAQWKADDMIRYNYFDHVRPGQDYANGLRLIGEQGLGCAWANENILQTTPQTHTSRGAFQIWMNSPGHRSAIMDGGRYGRTGFGVAGNKVVQHFCT